MNEKTIVKKSIFYLIGNLSSKIISAALIPIYAFFVSTDDLGLFDYSQSIMNVLVPVLYLTLWEGILKFVLTSEENDKNKLIGIASTFAVLSSLLYILIAAVGALFFPSPVVWLYTCGMVITHGLVWIWQYSCRALGQTKHYVFSSILSAGVLLISTVLLVCVLDLGVVGLYLSFILGQLTLLISIELRIKLFKTVSVRGFEFSLFRKIALFSIPLMFNTLSMWIVPLLMRTIVINMISTDASGLYAFANKFNIVVNLLGTVVSMALVEEAIISSKDGKVSKEYGKTVTDIIIKFAQLSSVAVLVIALAYSLFASTEYYVTIHYFPWFLFAALVSTLGSYIGTVFQSINITKYQFTTTLIGGVTGLIVALALTQQIGLWGIVTGQLITSIVTTASRYIIVRRKSGFRLSWRSLLINGIPTLVAVFLASFCDNIFVNIAATAVVTAIVLIMNKDFIGSLIKKLFVRGE